MKETFRYFRQQIVEAKDVAKLQWKSFAAAAALLLILYSCSLYILPGWVSWVSIVPPALIVAITSLARVNDIGPERMGKRWQVRKVGLIMAGAGSVMILATPFLTAPAFPTWRVVIIMWGFALTWLTTPDHPPWDYYVTGKYRFLSHPPDKPRSPLNRAVVRITGTIKVAELLKAQAEWEAKQAADEKARRSTRRGDGDGP